MAMAMTKRFEVNKGFIDIVRIFLAACFLGLCAQIKIPIPFTPIPFTIQTVAVMLIGAFLGSRKGVAAIFCYLAQGCLDLPVWAGGAGGIIHFFGPTGGYLMAYPLQAFVIGWSMEQKKASLSYAASILIFSVVIQLAIGSFWLAQFVGWDKCLTYGFYPFIMTECAKALLVAKWIVLKSNRAMA